jgi:hypothetical protein
MAMTVCSLLNRDKEWLAEEVVRLSTLARGLEVRRPADRSTRFYRPLGVAAGRTLDCAHSL